MAKAITRQEPSNSGCFGKWDCVTLVGVTAIIGVGLLVRHDIDKGNKPSVWVHYDQKGKGIDGGVNF